MAEPDPGAEFTQGEFPHHIKLRPGKVLDVAGGELDGFNEIFRDFGISRFYLGGTYLEGGPVASAVFFFVFRQGGIFPL
jgi:hypothetical protein